MVHITEKISVLKVASTFLGLLLLLRTVKLSGAYALNHKIVKVEETGEFFFVQSNGVKRLVPDDETLMMLLADDMRVDPNSVTVVSADVLSLFETDTMPSLKMTAMTPDEKMRTFVQHSEIVEYPWYWTDTFKISGVFNPAIIRWHNASLICWRGGPESYTYLRFSWLTDDFSQLDLRREYLGISSAQNGSRLRNSPYFNHTEEDPRMLVLSDNSLMVSYVSCLNDCPGDYFNTTITYFLIKTNPITGKAEFGESIYLDYTNAQQPEDYTYFYGVRTVKQKNWVPFEYEGRIHFLHTIYPMHVLEVTGKDSRNFGIFKTIVKEEEQYPIPWKKSYGWPLRGGSAAIYLKDRGVYFTIFHAVVKKSKKHERLTYVMGGLTFCGSPPFNILSMSTVPIVKQELYQGKWASGDIFYVIFPAGLQLSDDGRFVWISIGHQDKDGYVMKLELDGLLKSLTTFNVCGGEIA